MFYQPTIGYLGQEDKSKANPDGFSDALPYLIGGGALIIGQKFFPESWSKRARYASIAAGLGLAGFGVFQWFFKTPDTSVTKAPPSAPGTRLTPEELMKKEALPASIVAEYIREERSPWPTIGAALLMMLPLYLAVSGAKPQWFRGRPPIFKLTLKNNTDKPANVSVLAKKYPIEAKTVKEEVTTGPTPEREWPPIDFQLAPKETKIAAFDPEIARVTDLKRVQFILIDTSTKKVLDVDVGYAPD